MIIPTLMLVAMHLQPVSSGQSRRVYQGVEDTQGKYPYVVALVSNYRRCTGTLIAPNWVLTAAHCFRSSTYIQYGNMTAPHADTTRRILDMMQPPTPSIKEPDIGLMYVDKVDMKEYGQVSAVDYKAMEGHPIEYAGYGLTHKTFSKDIEKEFNLDQVRGLQLGQGVVIKCEKSKQETSFAPYVCIAPKCSNKEQQTLSGDPGGPLFYDGKLAGVHIGGELFNTVRYYTPVSPYLEWIHDVINLKYNLHLISRSGIESHNNPIKYMKLHNISRYLHGLKMRLHKYRANVLSALFQEVARS